jgi:hypothetical protein
MLSPYRVIDLTDHRVEMAGPLMGLAALVSIVVYSRHQLTQSRQNEIMRQLLEKVQRESG